MSYDVFISYEISESSLAYELAAVLSRNSMTYYLDCVNSSVALNDYVKKLLRVIDRTLGISLDAVNLG